MIQGLDGLRAIAFLLVLAWHTSILSCGWLDVTLFFVLSGYLLTPILVQMCDDLGTKLFRAFYGRRTLRIFPVYYAYLIAMGALTVLLAEGFGWKPFEITSYQGQALYAATYTYNFFHASSAFERTPLLSHFWSLAVEEQYYLVWPLLVFFAGRERIKPALLAIVLFGPVVRLLTLAALTSLSGSVVYPDLPLVLYVLPWTHFDAFAIGGLAAMTTIRRPVLQLACTSVAAVAVGMGSEYLATGSVGPLSALGYPVSLQNSYKMIWGYSLLNYVFALLIYCVAKHGLFHSVLETRLMRYLGKISYGLYIFHSGVVMFVIVLCKKFGIPTDSFTLVAISLPCSILVAGASYRFLEAPLLEMKDRLFPKLPPG
jgi:peptidoglycan/LPS O-acetylase OafA/YrhL